MPLIILCDFIAGHQITPPNITAAGEYSTLPVCNVTDHDYTHATRRVVVLNPNNTLKNFALPLSHDTPRKVTLPMHVSYLTELFLSYMKPRYTKHNSTKASHIVAILLPRHCITHYTYQCNISMSQFNI